MTRAILRPMLEEMEVEPVPRGRQVAPAGRAEVSDWKGRVRWEDRMGNGM